MCAKFLTMCPPIGVHIAASIRGNVFLRVERGCGSQATFPHVSSLQQFGSTFWGFSVANKVLYRKRAYAHVSLSGQGRQGFKEILGRCTPRGSCDNLLQRKGSAEVLENALAIRRIRFCPLQLHLLLCPNRKNALPLKNLKDEGA